MVFRYFRGRGTHLGMSSRCEAELYLPGREEPHAAANKLIATSAAFPGRAGRADRMLLGLFGGRKDRPAMHVEDVSRRACVRFCARGRGGEVGFPALATLFGLVFPTSRSCCWAIYAVGVLSLRCVRRLAPGKILRTCPFSSHVRKRNRIETTPKRVEYSEVPPQPFSIVGVAEGRGGASRGAFCSDRRAGRTFAGLKFMHLFFYGKGHGTKHKKHRMALY
ncbi:hypothetical protein LX32DRAFT_280210 [Colletotrichum zoysiae]|uniref:Uncharacterized protein n=1 Tax=Colletotrichum zoysiae TaxID=1216348 RepID=A0AAD9HNI3_9PEZI|nr:hypothetical protein LX32DRAFT_280210 [Colletotrichum zoysiae]